MTTIKKCTFAYQFFIQNIKYFIMIASFNSFQKSILLIFIFSFIYSLTAYSQNSNAADAEKYIPQSEYRVFRLGISGGMGFSWMKPKTDGYEKNGSTFSYSYGLLTDYNFTKNYTFSSGINFNRLGGKLKLPKYTKVVDSIGEGTIYRTYQINSLEIPTLLKLKTNQIGYITYFAQLGLKHNFNLSSFANDELHHGESVTSTKDIDMADFTTFYRVSINLGFGVEYALSQTLSAFAYLEYDNGLNSSLTKQKTNSNGELRSPNENAFIRKFGVTFGLLF